LNFSRQLADISSAISWPSDDQNDGQFHSTQMHRRNRNGTVAAAPERTTRAHADHRHSTTLKLSRFYEGLKVEGFFRNQNLTVEYHPAEGDYARLPELAADLVIAALR
jgi:hypothetical protein